MSPPILDDSSKVARKLTSPHSWDDESGKPTPEAFPSQDFLNESRGGLSVDDVTGLTSAEICELVVKFAGDRSTTTKQDPRVALRALVQSIQEINENGNQIFIVERTPVVDNDRHCQIRVFEANLSKSIVKKYRSELRDLFLKDCIMCS